MSLNFLCETEPFKKLVQAVCREDKGLELTGFIEPAKPFFLASFLSEAKRNIVFVRPAHSNLPLFAEQSRFFLSQFSSESRVSYFPPLAENPYEDIPPALDSVATRMKFFFDLIYDPPQLIVTNTAALLWPFPHAENLKQFFLELNKGETLDRDSLIERLESYGYDQEAVVNSHGEFAWRGGIVDAFSPWQDFPYRVEFSGDEVASLREFDPSSQKSLRKVDRLVIPSLFEFPFSPSFLDDWERAARDNADAKYVSSLRKATANLRAGEIPPSFYSLSLLASSHFVPYQHFLQDYLFILDDSDETNQEWEESLRDYRVQHQERLAQNRDSLPPEKIFFLDLWDSTEKSAVHVKSLSSPSASNRLHFPFQSVPRFDNKIPFFLEYLKKSLDKGERISVYFSGDGVRHKLNSLLAQQQIPSRESSDPFSLSKDGAVTLLVGDLARGFGYPKLKLTFFSEQDIFTEERVLVSRPQTRPFISQFRDLKSGDYVVHTDYGIGIFKGLIKLEVDRKNRECIEILYKDEDRLFIPVEDLNLVQKYSSLGSVLPILNKLGTPHWAKTKQRTKKAIEQMAKDLLHLYAQRKAMKGYGFSHSGQWQAEFDKTFEYEETEDQNRAIGEILLDMESSSPMDRLLCGDVGYGKTEVALRAAFKSVMDGKQVAVLCPTTVLASQHLQTFRNRMVFFPVRVESLTRLQTKTQQREIIKDVRKGLVDIIIGTHRLLSQDVDFHDLGLLIIDEEQRFGVKHKEKLKEMRKTVDALT
ncbi:MAG: CarD family transcriptional regulator, partial [Candidatus Aminicenantes bacterium]